MTTLVEVTRAQAAEHVFRSPETIRWWVRQGWLTPVGVDELGRRTYDLQQVLDVERDRAQHPRGGQAKAARRRAAERVA